MCSKYADQARLCFVTGHFDHCTIVGVFETKFTLKTSPQNAVASFISETVGSVQKVEEITEIEFVHLLRLADMSQFIEDDCEITRLFSLNKFQHTSDFFCHEKIYLNSCSENYNAPMN